jgi:hypothetical protein
MLPADLETEIILLGIAERSAILREGETDILKWNIMGLKSVLPCFFFPCALTSMDLTFVIRGLAAVQTLKMVMRSETGDGGAAQI